MGAGEARAVRRPRVLAGRRPARGRMVDPQRRHVRPRARRCRRRPEARDLAVVGSRVPGRPRALERTGPRGRRRRPGRRVEGPRAHVAVVRRGDVRQGARARRRPARRRRRTQAARVPRIRDAAASRTAPPASRATRPRSSRATTKRAGSASRSANSTRAWTRSRRASRRWDPALRRSADLRADDEARSPRAARASAREVQPAASLQRPEARAAVPAARRAPHASDHLDRGAAGCGQVHAGRELRRGAQAARHLVPGGPRRRGSRDVLPLPAHRGGRPVAPPGEARGGAARVLGRVRRRPAGVHAAVPARVLRAVPGQRDAGRRQLPRAQGASPAGGSRSRKACARSRRA